MKKLWLISLLFVFGGCLQSDTPKNESPPLLNQSQADEKRLAELAKVREVIQPFFIKMGKPQKGDWLEKIPEPGQTFEEYLKSKPITPTAEKQTIYIQPIGVFSDKQRNVLLLTAAYMRAFYNLPVQLLAEKVLGNVPAKWTRKNQFSGQTQIETTYFTDELLPKIIPNDAAALICLTNADLYPKEKWSFVFGLANLRERVGVWSLYRFGNPEKSEADYRLFLARTLKIAMHETGHMFSMRHCTKYECLMSGTNNLGETDRRPLDVCPECLAKICWAMKYDPAERYEKLAKFWREQNSAEEAQTFTKKAEAVRKLFENGI